MSNEMEQWLEELLRLNDEDEKMTDKQMKILQSAVEIFAEKGFSATSTSEIASKAGVAEGTIFRHYKTKKDLLISIVAPMMSKLIAPFLLRDFQKVLDSKYERFEDFLRAVMRNRLAFVQKNAPIIKVMVHEIPFHPELQNRFKELITENVASRVERVVVHFQSKGDLVEMAPFSAIRLAVSSIVGYIVVRCFVLPDQEWNDEEEIERTVDFIMHGLSPRRGAGAGPGPEPSPH